MIFGKDYLISVVLMNLNMDQSFRNSIYRCLKKTNRKITIRGMEYVEKYLRSVISRILFSAVEIMNRDERKILRWEDIQCVVQIFFSKEIALDISRKGTRTITIHNSFGHEAAQKEIFFEINKVNTLCRDILSNHKMQPKVGIYICAVVEVLMQVLAGLITGIITREKLKKELSKKPLIVVT